MLSFNVGESCQQVVDLVAVLVHGPGLRADRFRPVRAGIAAVHIDIPRRDGSVGGDVGRKAKAGHGIEFGEVLADSLGVRQTAREPERHAQNGGGTEGVVQIQSHLSRPADARPLRAGIQRVSVAVVIVIGARALRVAGIKSVVLS